MKRWAARTATKDDLVTVATTAATAHTNCQAMIVSRDGGKTRFRTDKGTHSPPYELKLTLKDYQTIVECAGADCDFHTFKVHSSNEINSLTGSGFALEFDFHCNKQMW